MGELRFCNPELGPIVLLADDEPLVRGALARLLRAEGCTVFECGDGESAAALAATRPFDVVVSDIEMPHLGGVEMLQRLRERAILTPVVLMTGAPSIDSAIKAVELGAFKYLMKPVDPAALIDTIELATKPRATGADSSQRLRPVEARGSASAEPVAPGEVLADRYRLLRLLGEGGMGQVWEAVQLSTNRAVALKLLHSSLNGSVRSDMRKRMLLEARVASSMAHPNVVDVLDMFELDDGTPVLVMALLRGQTLGHRLADGKALSVIEAADLLLPVVSAVGAAHANGVVHRDLKPENIFLAEEGGRTVVKVLDFGIAKLVSNEAKDGAGLTAAGTAVGTPGYMAPEQAMGERDVDHRADIWSLGAILYEVLSGVRPVQAVSLGQAIRKLLTEAITPLSERASDVLPEVAPLVDRMLARERDRRPSDLREVREELARHARVASPDFGAPSAGKAGPSLDSAPSDEALGHARTEIGDAAAKRPG